MGRLGLQGIKGQNGTVGGAVSHHHRSQSRRRIAPSEPAHITTNRNPVGEWHPRSDRLASPQIVIPWENGPFGGTGSVRSGMIIPPCLNQSKVPGPASADATVRVPPVRWQLNGQAQITKVRNPIGELLPSEPLAPTAVLH